MNVIAIYCSNCKSQIKFDADKLNLAKPAVRCPICQHINQLTAEQLPQKKAAMPTEDKTEIDLGGVIGWLIVHDEQTKEQVFNLKFGKNVVGRASQSKPADVGIVTEDKYMSRNHCVLEIKTNQIGKFQYIIYDIGSTNGTYINGNKDNKLKPDTQLILKEGDTIQIGRTKVVLKTVQQNASAEAARQTVIISDYEPTVIL